MLLWSKSAAPGQRHALEGCAQHPCYRMMLGTVFSDSGHAPPGSLPTNFSSIKTFIFLCGFLSFCITSYSFFSLFPSLFLSFFDLETSGGGSVI
jgi:hypothetical protein